MSSPTLGVGEMGSWYDVDDKYIWRLGQIQFGKTHFLIRKQQKNEDSSYQLPGGALLTSSLHISWNSKNILRSFAHHAKRLKRFDELLQRPLWNFWQHQHISVGCMNCCNRDGINCCNRPCHFLSSSLLLSKFTPSVCNVVAGVLQ